MPGTVTGQFEVRGDSDFFRVHFEAGRTYQLSSGNNGPNLELRLPDGTLFTVPVPYTGLMTFVAPVTGDYWVTAQHLGGSQFYTIEAIEVPDPTPASVETTLTLDVGETRSAQASIGQGSDDWYAIELVAGQSYFLRSFETHGTLYLSDSNGDLITVQGDQLHFTATMSGTYYAGIHARGNAYSLSLEAVADDRGESATSAGTITVGGTATGVWETARDADWYAVTLTAGSSYMLSLTPDSTGVYGNVRIFNSAGQLVQTTIDASSPSTLVFSPDSTDTYYLSAGTGSNYYNPHGNWTYSLSATELANDVLGNALTTAELTIGAVRPGRFDGTGDIDWFAVTLTAGQSYMFALAMSATSIGYTPRSATLYDAAGNVVSTITGGTSDTNLLFSQTVTATGLYYFGIRNGTGVTNYTLTTSTYADDFANNSSTTGVLTVGGTASGTFEVNGDRDWFAVELVGGLSYQLSEPGGLIYDADGNLLSELGWGDLHVSPSVSGTYYLEVSGGTGAYSVGISQVNDDYREDPSSTGYLRRIVNGTSGADIFVSTVDHDDFRGGDGDDWFIPGLGNDRFLGGAGIDTVTYAGFGTGVTVNLANGRVNVGDQQIGLVLQTENVIGTDHDDMIIGSSAANLLIGGDGNDTLIGGSGADRLFGGAGDDSYHVERIDDLVFEDADGGTDTVTAFTSFYLYDHIENLTLSEGLGDAFGVGNSLANTIVGNESSNLLIAGAGDDTVRGGAGVDSLFGESGNDQLFGDAGIDYLVGGIGNDTLDGGANEDALYGEDGDDILIGGSDFATDILVGGAGNDILRGDSGAGDYDLMDGGAGDDTYYVDTPADLTFEAANGGTDTVYALINGAGYYLYANVENLVLGGNTPFGVGNELNNRITGSDSANWLLGGAGDDILDGRGSNDVLFGEAGADTFVFAQGSGADVIGDFAVGTDRIDLSAYGLSWQTIQNSMHENGGTTAIDLGNGDMIVLNGVTRASLSEGDFILSAPAADKTPVMEVIDNDLFGDRVHDFYNPRLFVGPAHDVHSLRPFIELI